MFQCLQSLKEKIVTTEPSDFEVGYNMGVLVAHATLQPLRKSAVVAAVIGGLMVVDHVVVPTVVAWWKGRKAKSGPACTGESSHLDCCSSSEV